MFKTEFARGRGADCVANHVCAFTCRALLALTTAVFATACAAPDAKRSALRLIDAAAMQRTVERLAKEMLVPGAVVILRTPTGNFTSTYGVTTYKGAVPTSFVRPRHAQ